MRSLETIAAIVAAVLVLFLVPIVMRADYVGSCQEVVAESEVEALCSDLAKEHKLHLVEVETITKALMDCGYTGEFTITVYTYEEDLNGNIHRYMMSWDEIVTILGEEGVFSFPSDCYVRIEVPFHYEQNFLANIAFGRDGFERTFILGSGV